LSQKLSFDGVKELS